MSIVAQLGTNTTMKKLHIYGNSYRIYRMCHFSLVLRTLSYHAIRTEYFVLHPKPEPDYAYQNKLTDLFDL